MRVRCACLVLLLLAPVAGAQLTAKKATAQLRQVSKETLKELKLDMKVSRDVAFDAIDAFETKLKTGVEQTDIVDLCNALATFLAEVQQTARTASIDFAVACADLLGQIDDDDFDVVHGIYPDDFQYGTGGVLDDTRDAVASEAEKTSEQVFNRLGKTSKLLEKKAVIQMTVVRRPMAPNLLDYVINHTGVGGFSDATQLAIDLAITFSSASVLQDGFVFLAGSGSELLTSITVSVQSESTQATLDGDTDRWTASFGDAIDGLFEGNFEADAIGADGGARDTLLFTIR